MKKKILLVVDDNSHTAWSLGSEIQFYTKRDDLDLRVFTDPDEAMLYVKNLESNQIWGAIIDLWMIDKTTQVEDPKKGKDVINSVKMYHPSARLAVLSAHIDQETKDDLSKLKVLAFKKPISMGEIFEALKNKI